MTEPQVILVDNNDEVIGSMGKQEAHVQGKLHRAISILVFNTKGEWLIHQRAKNKYHCGGLWTNACCSHPAPGESSEEAAIRRLQQEMGLYTKDIEKLFKFKYKAAFDNELTEHEIDHVFRVVSNDTPEINEEEVADYKYLTGSEISRLMRKHPLSFTPWFKLIFDRITNDSTLVL
ncbi:MAG: isopentenyl-diphosphate Delta-isomerase [Reichenbachiella sp.]